MLKQLFTLARGRSEDAAEALIDANALSILRQQLREASAGVEKSRRALAVVMAYAEREKASLVKLEAQTETLKNRALDAIEKDREDLALEASEAIADMEADAVATRKAIDTYSFEIARLRQCLKESESHLIHLKRGQRMAEANDKAIKLRSALPNVSQSDLQSAGETLDKLRERQDQATATAKAMEELSTQMSAKSLDDRLAAAGCGAPKQSDGSAVLARLKASKK